MILQLPETLPELLESASLMSYKKRHYKLQTISTLRNMSSQEIIPVIIRILNNIMYVAYC